MKFRAFLIPLILCVASVPVFSQAAASGTDVTASADDIKRMFDVMHIRDQMKLVMDQVSQQMRTIGHDQLRKSQPSVTDEDIARLDKISDEVTKSMSIEGLLDEMIPVYQKHLSRADVDAMIGFYSTPTGQKILREMPAMTREGMQAMQPRLRQMMDDANTKIEKMMKEGMEKKDDTK